MCRLRPTVLFVSSTLSNLSLQYPAHSEIKLPGRGSAYRESVGFLLVSYDSVLKKQPLEGWMARGEEDERQDVTVEDAYVDVSSTRRLVFICL